MQLTALGLITTVIIAILAYIAGLRKDSTDRLRSRDKKIFAEMISTIPDNIARYIEEHDFGEVHNGKVHEVLLDFDEYCQRPNAFFNDKRLEDARKRLLDEANDFYNILVDETETMGQGDFRTPTMNSDFDERKRIGDKINVEKRKFYEAYVNFRKIASINLA